MPIYEYRCKACGNVSEYLTGVGRDEPICCKTCGGKELERILSAASISMVTSDTSQGRKYHLKMNCPKYFTQPDSESKNGAVRMHQNIS